MNETPAPHQKLDEQQLIAWLRLIRSENVGPATFRTLINRYGGAQSALDAIPDLAKRGGKAIRIASRDDAEREIDQLQRLGGRFICSLDAEYPAALKHIDAPPPLLSVIGSPALLQRHAVAIVGSRNASALGRRFTRDMAAELGQHGFAIVSGLARGIDGAAHEASLHSGTIAVLAGGINRLYPPEHADLFAKIKQAGAVITEMPLGWTATARDFPRRNRIVSGIALGTLVIEAAERSGSLITARMAAEQGRIVFAMPGSPLDPRASGTNSLLKNGATMVTCAADVIEGLAGMTSERLPESIPVMFRSNDDEDNLPLDMPAEDDRSKVLSALGSTAVDIDTLVQETGVSVGVVQTILLELELADRIERQHGNRISFLG